VALKKAGNARKSGECRKNSFFPASRRPEQMFEIQPRV
jgi:hypothetical protein